ncbi:hypothetical protein ACIQM4_34450 [Streptomyces sp. NPDC091272]|uniref:hypothetical protein n=1 Tax=Streptomyces sp. NPDC091272 TaxID=3365981 RepID=UPI0038252C3D
MEIPEKKQAEALARVAEVGTQRAAALAEAERLTGPLRAAAVAAAKEGAGRNRIRELAGVSPNTLYKWLTEAGLDVRPKKTKGE